MDSLVNTMLEVNPEKAVLLSIYANKFYFTNLLISLASSICAAKFVASE